MKKPFGGKMLRRYPKSKCSHMNKDSIDLTIHVANVRLQIHSTTYKNITGMPICTNIRHSDICTSPTMPPWHKVTALQIILAGTPNRYAAWILCSDMACASAASINRTGVLYPG